MKLLPEKIEDAEIVKMQISVVFDQSIEMLGKAIAEIQSDAVISVGQHGGSNGLLI